MDILEKLKFILFSVIILAILALLGYWAFSSLQSGSEHLANQKIEELTLENKALKKEMEDLTNELYIYKPKEKEQEEEIKPEAEPVEPIAHKNQDLINELQKLVDANILMKLKSSGTRVGTVQRFLNIYNNTSSSVDNDYGAGTETKVKAFQKDQGIVADGEAGAGTFRKMIEWLKKS